MTKTPKTPKTDKNIHTCGECGPTVDVDFARQLEEALTNLLANPYPHDLIAIRLEVEREWGGDEKVAQEEMDTYCTREYMLEAREKWKSAENAARKLLNL